MNIKIPKQATDIFESLGDKFEQERDGKDIRRDFSAFFCSNKYPSSIQTVSLDDVIEGDILIHMKTGKRYYIVDVTPLSEGVIAKYETDYERKKQSNLSNQVFNIGSINGNSIIGSQQYATIDNSSTEYLENLVSKKPLEDQELLEKFLERVKIVIDDNQPVSKGTFAKFSEILNKYPDIINSAGSLILKWLSSTN